LYKNLNFAKDFKTDPCGTIRLKKEVADFSLYSTVTVNGVKININNLRFNTGLAILLSWLSVDTEWENR